MRSFFEWGVLQCLILPGMAAWQQTSVLCGVQGLAFHAGLSAPSAMVYVVLALFMYSF